MTPSRRSLGRMRPVPWQANHQFGVFTARQAAASGWTPAALKKGIARDRLIRLRRGVYAEPPDSSLNEYERSALLLGQKGVAAALTIPDATVTHAAALAVHTLPLHFPPEVPCVTKPQGLRTQQVDLHLHRKLLVPKFLDPRADISLSSVARACVDVACESGVHAGVIASDAALHRGMTTWDELLMARCSIKGDVGSPNARRLLELVDGRSESPIESLSRVNLAGLVPPPQVQPRIYTVDGVFIGRVDLLWEIPGLVGEVDGKNKYRDDDEALFREKLRHDALSDTNAVMARWGASLAARPQALAAYVGGRLEAAWQRWNAGFRPQWVVVPSPPVGRAS